MRPLPTNLQPQFRVDHRSRSNVHRMGPCCQVSLYILLAGNTTHSYQLEIKPAGPDNPGHHAGLVDRCGERGTSTNPPALPLKEQGAVIPGHSAGDAVGHRHGIQVGVGCSKQLLPVHPETGQSTCMGLACLKYCKNS